MKEGYGKCGLQQTALQGQQGEGANLNGSEEVFYPLLSQPVRWVIEFSRSRDLGSLVKLFFLLSEEGAGVPAGLPQTVLSPHSPRGTHKNPGKMSGSSVSTLTFEMPSASQCLRDRINNFPHL